MASPKYLLDVNVLVALTDSDHEHHELTTHWFDPSGLDWGVCAFTEAGFLRVSTNPKVSNLSMDEATEILASLANLSGYRFWPITAGWTSLVAPFSERIFGHKQITDAYLLGLAVQEDAILVTLDKTFRYLAGTQHSQNVLVLEAPPTVGIR